MDFQSAAPAVVRDIRQRDLLNTWLRLYAREDRLPAISEYVRTLARSREAIVDLSKVTKLPAREVVPLEQVYVGCSTTTTPSVGVLVLSPAASLRKLCTCAEAMLDPWYGRSALLVPDSVLCDATPAAHAVLAEISLEKFGSRPTVHRSVAINGTVVYSEIEVVNRKVG